jgi:hypothetical protein
MRCEALVFGLMLVGGCAPPAPTAGGAPAVEVPAPEGCAADAERLEAPAAVRARPAADAAIVGRLAAGRFVLRCAARGGWQFVRAPALGAPVDCAAGACAGGWIEAATPTRRYG